jgi:hypothetical protein
MATIQSSLSRFQTSTVVGGRIQAGVLATTVTPIRHPPSRQPSPRPTNLLSLPNEPEDARLTGGTRSLDRRLLALNVAGYLSRPKTAKMVAVSGAAAAPRSAA